MPGVFEVNDADLDDFYRTVSSMLDSFAAFERRESRPVTNVPARRQPGPRPTRTEDPLNAVVRWCTVQAGSDGLLSGKRIGLKDNISIAGVPLTCGSQVLQGYIPQ